MYDSEAEPRPELGFYLDLPRVEGCKGLGV